MSTYDPENRASRAALAEHLIAKITAWGFAEIDAGARERVYAREINPGLQCRIFTSIEGREIRPRDADAIRVCLVYVGGDRVRPLRKDRRVYRTGVIEEIVGRVRERVDRIAEGLEYCRDCGAPKFKSSRGNMVCAALCWKAEPDPEPKPAPKPAPAVVRTQPERTTYKRRADAPRGREW